MVRLRSFTTFFAFLGACVLSTGSAMAAERNRESARERIQESDRPDDDNNPPPPNSDPGMKRVRSVALPGQPSRPPIPHTEKQTQSDARTDPRPVGVQGNAVLSSEAGFGVVRKPDGREFATTHYPARLIQLNGVDISAVRGETLENVTVRIDDAGNLELRAPHYDVGMDTSFHPLLPTELPRVPKGKSSPRDLPQGIYSKGSAEAVSRKAKGDKGEVPVLRSPAPPAAPSIEILREGESDEVPEEGRAGPKALPAR